MLWSEPGKSDDQRDSSEQLWQYEFYGNDRVVDNHDQESPKKAGRKL